MKRRRWRIINITTAITMRVAIHMVITGAITEACRSLTFNSTTSGEQFEALSEDASRRRGARRDFYWRSNTGLQAYWYSPLIPVVDAPNFDPANPYGLWTDPANSGTSQ
jgi:hypothetical protein